MRLPIAITALALLLPLPARAQDPRPAVGTDTVLTFADSSFVAGGFHRFLFGREYRAVWERPIRAPVLDLQAFDGGLKPTKLGGGMQTKSLRFESGNGREWVFRTARKDARVILPKSMRKSFVADLVNDQLSHSNPGGALTVPHMLDQLGVLHATPQFAVMPDDPALGEYRKAFAGQLGLLEEFPDDGPDGKPGFAGSTKIGSSLDLLEKLNDDPDDRVDARKFLTARLFDLLINDWDRHKDQWKWARFDRGDGHVWEPIPRDRDQAYIWFDGFFPSLARLGAPKLIGFDPTYPSLQGLTLNGRELDLALLNGLDWPVWDSIAHFVRARLTDEVIDSAVHLMPAEYQRLTGARVARVLKARREGLPAEARRFYQMLAKVVDIHATDARELAVIDRDSAGGLRVRLIDGRKKEPGTVDTREPYFDRRFLPEETEEVRVYLHGGGDSAIVRGTGERGIKLRVIGGKGDNQLVDSSRVALDAHATHLYDNGPGPHDLTYGPDTLFSRRPQLVEDGDTLMPPPDFGKKMAPALRLRYLTDVGVLFGAGVTVDQYAFRTRPYWYSTSLWAERGTGPNDTRVAGSADIYRENSPLHLRLVGQISGLELIRYYGEGNESVRTDEGRPFKVENTQYRLDASLAFPLGPGEFRLGPTLQYTTTGGDSLSFIERTAPYGSEDFGQVGGQFYASLDTRDSPGAPRSGVRLLASGSIFPSIWTVASTFGEVHGEVAGYLGARHLPLAPVLALRVGGKKVWGDYPYFEAAFLGGPEDLRGFDMNRFAGDATVWGNAELRLRLGAMHLLVPGTIGVHGLADLGRVWARGETSTRLHHAFGGGLWFSFEGPVSTLSLTIAHSDERSTGFYARAGFGF
jgi:hypothetical protein